MKYNEVCGTVAQISTIIKCRHYFQSSRFKTAQHGTVTKMFKNAVCDLQEEKKFLKYAGRQSWACKMHKLRDILLQTTVTDSEIYESQENENNVMRSVLKSFERHFLAHEDSLRQVKHRMRERGQSQAKDVERDNA